jgi:hypothetical protein
LEKKITYFPLLKGKKQAGDLWNDKNKLQESFLEKKLTTFCVLK